MNAVDDLTDLTEHLDFDVPCASATPAWHSAEVFMKCRGCGRGSFLCHTCLESIRTRLEILRGDAGRIVCRSCGREAPTFDDAVEVVPL